MTTHTASSAWVGRSHFFLLPSASRDVLKWNSREWDLATIKSFAGREEEARPAVPGIASEGLPSMKSLAPWHCTQTSLKCLHRKELSLGTFLLPLSL